MTRARCPSHPIVESSSFVVDFLSMSSLLMFVIQGMNLFSGRNICNCLKSKKKKNDLCFRQACLG